MARCPVAIVLLICGLASNAHAQSAAPAEPRPIDYSWKDGATTFTFRSVQAVLSNRLQLQWRERRRESRERERLVHVPRGRSQVSGWLGNEHLTYEAEVEWTEGPAMVDGFISWDALRNGTFNVQAGQFKVPIGRQRLTSSASQQFVDRSDVIDEFTPGRDIGVQVHGLLARNRVEYRAGVFNGAGQNTWRHDGGRQYAGRVMVQPFGNVEYSESELDFVESPRLAVAAGIESSDGRDDAVVARRSVVGVDVDVRYRGLSLLTEVFFRMLDDDADGAGRTGFLVQSGYLLVPRRVEVAGRFGAWRPAAAAAATRGELGLVGGYFVNGHNLKLQADVRRLSGVTADERATHEVRVQLQVVF